MRLLTVVGARPQLVKAALVSKALREMGMAETLIHTGQHYDEALSGRFFSELGIPEPAVNLRVGSLPHGAQTGRMLEGLEREIHQRQPAIVLVYGDTNSTLAAALAAAKAQVPVAHVEAGLRSFNRAMPEEVNRVLTDHLASWLFAPTGSAVSNLAAEGIAGERVALTGDVMYDAALLFGQDASLPEGLEPGTYVLATIHRAENTDHPARLRAILEGLALVARETAVLLPMHPRTRAILHQDPVLAATAAGLRVIDPVGYGEMLALERGAAVIATDSGGVQKEAFFARVPCVTLRDETEWVELVTTGWNVLCPPTSADAVARAISAATTLQAENVELYGNGQASKRIAAILAEALG